MHRLTVALFAAFLLCFAAPAMAHDHPPANCPTEDSTVNGKPCWDCHTQGNHQCGPKPAPKPCPKPVPTPPPTPPAPPCNCPPGPAGPAGPAGPQGQPGVTTTVTVVEQHTTVVYVDKTCTSHRVFRLKIGRAWQGKRITSATIAWTNGRVHHATARKGKDGRLHAEADFRGVKTVPGQVRVIAITAHVAGVKRPVHLVRRVRLCLRPDSDLNKPTDIPQNGNA